MKVILRADVSDVGKKGDIVDVADGYARNYLVPKGLALKATNGNVQQAASMRRSRDLRDAEDRGAAEEVGTVLVPAVITVTAKAGSEGRLFGSVTTADVADAVQAQTGIELDRRKLQLDEPIKSVGTHPVPPSCTPTSSSRSPSRSSAGADGLVAPAAGVASLARMPAGPTMALPEPAPEVHFRTCVRSVTQAASGCGQLGPPSTANPHACALHTHRRFGGE